MASKKYIIGSLVFLVALTYVYITFMGELRIDVTPTKTTFKIWNESTNKFDITGIETNKLYNGTKSVPQQSSIINFNGIMDVYNDTKSAKIFRQAKFGIPYINDYYYFEGNTKDKENFPVEHIVEVTNAKGLIYQYEVSSLYYNGATKNLPLDQTSMTFGKNMKVTWQSGFYSAKVTKLVGGKGKLTIKYKIKSDYDKFNLRLFDPPVTSLCYQENSTTSTSCGGLNTGSYGYSPNYFYVNYTKPSFSTMYSKWDVQHGLLSRYNVTLSNTCWNMNPLQLRIYSDLDWGSATGASYPQCYNGTWNTIGSTSTGSGWTGNIWWDSWGDYPYFSYDGNWSSWSAYNPYYGKWYHRADVEYNGVAAARIFEEAMWWNISSNVITINSPQNKTYGINDIYFNWSATDNSWSAISIDGQPNITTFHDLIFQDTPDNYTCTGTWNPTYTCSKGFDTNWSTYSQISDLGSYNNITYNTSVDYAQWSIRAWNAATINHSIPDYCRNKKNTKLRIDLDSDASGDNLYLYCFNGTELVNFDTALTQLGQLYEEGLWYNVSATNITVYDLSDGLHNVTFYTNDSFGNMNSTTMYFTIDTTDPTISIVSPTHTGNYTHLNWEYVNTTIYDASNITSLIDFNRSLVGWWRFNREAGENDTFVRDWSSYGNNGTMKNMNLGIDNGTSGWTNNGKFGNGMMFDGTNRNTHISIANSASLNFTNQMTISLWMFSTGGGERFLVDKNRFSNAFDLAVTSSLNRLRFGFETIEDGEHSLTMTSNMRDNIWYHVVAIFDPSDSTKKQKIYINGVLNVTSNYTGTMSGNSGVLKIGTYMGSSTNSWNGTIDDVRIYNRALSPEEINASYNAGLYRLYHNFTNLVNGTTYNYTVYAQDIVGNVAQSETKYITYDNTTTKVTLYLNDSSSDRYYELGSYAKLVGNLTYLDDVVVPGNVFLDINTSGYGTNYTNSTSGSVSYNFRTFASTNLFHDNASNTDNQSYTYQSIDGRTTKTFGWTLNNRDSIKSVKLNLSSISTFNTIDDDADTVLCEGTFSPTFTCSNTTDGNWDTRGQSGSTSGNVANVTETYMIPYVSRGFPINITAKLGSTGGVGGEATVYCYNTSSIWNTLITETSGFGVNDTANVPLSCQVDGFVKIKTRMRTNGIGLGYLWETKLIFSTPSENITIDVNGDGIDKYYPIAYLVSSSKNIFYLNKISTNLESYNLSYQSSGTKTVYLPMPTDDYTMLGASFNLTGQTLTVSQNNILLNNATANITVRTITNNLWIVDLNTTGIIQSGTNLRFPHNMTMEGNNIHPVKIYDITSSASATSPIVTVGEKWGGNTSLRQNPNNSSEILWTPSFKLNNNEVYRIVLGKNVTWLNDTTPKLISVNATGTYPILKMNITGTSLQTDETVNKTLVSLTNECRGECGSYVEGVCEPCGSCSFNTWNYYYNNNTADSSSQVGCNGFYSSWDSDAYTTSYIDFMPYDINSISYAKIGYDMASGCSITSTGWLYNTLTSGYDSLFSSVLSGCSKPKTSYNSSYINATKYKSSSSIRLKTELINPTASYGANYYETMLYMNRSAYNPTFRIGNSILWSHSNVMTSSEQTAELKDYITRDINLNFTSGAKYGELLVYFTPFWSSSPENVTIKVGYSTINNYANTTVFNTSQSISFDDYYIRNYITRSSCSSQKSCNVPFYITSKTAGILEVSNINFTYSYPSITLNTTAMTVDNPNIDLTFYNGNITIQDLNVTYKASKNISVTAHNADNSLNDTQNILIVWSNMSLTKPYTWTDDLLVYPETNSSVNVEPYYQTSTTPIWNLTSQFYHDQNVNISVKLDQDIDSCMNVTANTGYYPDNATRITTAETELAANVGNTGSIGLWLFYDLYNCPETSLYINPNMTIYPYCSSCVW